MEIQDITDLIKDSRVKIIAGCPEQELYMAIYNAIKPNFLGLKEMKMIPWPASVKIHTSYYEKATKTFTSVTDSFLAGRGNDPYDTLAGYEHFLININEYLENPGSDPTMVKPAAPAIVRNICIEKKRSMYTGMPW